MSSRYLGGFIVFLVLAWATSSAIHAMNNQGGIIYLPLVTNAAAQAVLEDNSVAQWAVNWTCGGGRCPIEECSASIDALVENPTASEWLSLRHEVTWDEPCATRFNTDFWVFEVNRYTGEERSGEFRDNLLYNYWDGRQLDPATDVLALQNGQKVAARCSGPQELELEETGGWSTTYMITICHDVNTGLMLSLSYTKHWLFTGEYEGERYDHAYFGDYETLEQRLGSTNLELSYTH